MFGTLVAIVRHGQRTTDPGTSYQNDPYKNHKFYPYGPGMLTNEGKTAVYTVGKAYRERYNNHLGEIYLPECLETWTSEYIRAKTSAQLFLAGLYPPKGILKWNDGLDWQPIHTNCYPIDTDELMVPVVKTEKFKVAYKEAVDSDIGKAILRKYCDIIPYIENNIGEKVINTRKLWTVRDCLQTQEELGLPIPEWSRRVYPGRLLQASYEEYRMQMCTKELKRCVSGTLLKKILTDTRNKIENKSEYKMHLYVGHDVNIANTLEVFGLMYDHLPNYASSISIEVREINGRYGIRIYYKKDKDVDFQLMKFPNGEKILWLEELEHLVDNIWNDDPCHCDC